MPIYEYVCDHCGYETEVMQKMNDAPLTTCPKCQSDTFHKIMSAAGFQLKGNGYYETDFKNSGKPAACPAAEGGSCPACH